ncbi:hypothetical protein AJ87_40465 [Rhizobium yanglingense]|nr:hypothetical protein AJ87_40465 [Rhizobium yanglingense]
MSDGYQHPNRVDHESHRSDPVSEDGMGLPSRAMSGAIVSGWMELCGYETIRRARLRHAVRCNYATFILQYGDTFSFRFCKLQTHTDATAVVRNENSAGVFQS